MRFTKVLLIILLSCIYGNTSEGRNNFLLVYTLDGKFTLVDRQTGVIKWTYDSGLVNDCVYSGDVILIPEIQSGNLYEYPGTKCGDVLYKLDRTVLDIVTRSPEAVNNLKTSGYKSDHWIQLNLDTGEVLKSARCLNSYQCFGANTERSDAKTRVLNMGVSEFHFMMMEDGNDAVKVNVTFQSIPTHLEPDIQNSKIVHAATLEPSIVTFDSLKFLWHLPLSAPVVDLFAVEAEETKPMLSDRQGVVSLNSQTESHRLRRIDFNTYALDLNETFSTTDPVTKAALWTSKFTSKNTFVPSIHIGEAVTPPIYVVHTLAEASLQPRHVQRLMRTLLLAYDRVKSGQGVFSPCSQEKQLTPNEAVGEPEEEAEMRREGRMWPRSLPGDYLMLVDSPRVNPNWSPKVATPHGPSKSRLMHIEGTKNPGPLLLSWQEPKVTFPHLFATVVTSVALVLAFVYHVWFRKTDTFDYSTGLLHPSFEEVDSNGWAGHKRSMAQGGGMASPGVLLERVRFRITKEIGWGSHGTVVFEGHYGEQEVAVKRILRQAGLDKTWKRERDVLLNVHHENLLRCLWTGSSTTFHYLALQRCAASLLEAMEPDDGQSKGQGRAAIPTGSHPLQDRFCLSPVLCVKQLLTAIQFLHRKNIVHRDIKPSNIFIIGSSGEGYRLVVGDFGLSLHVDSGQFTNSFSYDLQPTEPGASTASANHNCVTGSFGWIAPEMCAPSGEPLTNSVDVYAFGLVSYFIFTRGCHPFYEMPQRPSDAKVPSKCLGDTYHSLAAVQKMQHRIILNEKPRLMDLKDCITAEDGKVDRMRSSLAQLLVMEALVHDPSQRCSIDVLAASPLFWQGRDIMIFYTEISNFVDDWKVPKLATSGTASPGQRRLHAGSLTTASASANDSLSFPPPSIRTVNGEGDVGNTVSGLRLCFRDELNKRYHRVCSGSWVDRIDPRLQTDLKISRTYDGRSLTHLLRAVRNKRNHLWSSGLEVREVLGCSDDSMSAYWDTQFPALLPLVYCLARVHLFPSGDDPAPPPTPPATAHHPPSGLVAAASAAQQERAQREHFRQFLPAGLGVDQAEAFIAEHCEPPLEPERWARRTTSEEGSSPTSPRRTLTQPSPVNANPWRRGKTASSSSLQNSSLLEFSDPKPTLEEEREDGEGPQTTATVGEEKAGDNSGDELKEEIEGEDENSDSGDDDGEGDFQSQKKKKRRRRRKNNSNNNAKTRRGGEDRRGS